MRHETLLVEIGTEELPPKSLLALQTAFAENMQKALDARQFQYGPVAAFATPRRLAVRIADCVEIQPEQLVQRKGPKLSAAFDGDGKPTKALSGFLKSCELLVGHFELFLCFSRLLLIGPEKKKKRFSTR